VRGCDAVSGDLRIDGPCIYVGAAYGAFA